MAEKKTSLGSKLSRSQTVTVRFDPKLKYLADLAARKQRRTVSSFIEWAVDEALNQIVMEEDLNHQTTLSDIRNELWDIDEAERFGRLAIRYPELLTHDEQVLWKVITDSNLHLMARSNHSPTGAWLSVELTTIFYPELRKNWQLFNDIAAGIEDKSQLPKWEIKCSSSNTSLYDDDCPF